MTPTNPAKASKKATEKPAKAARKAAEKTAKKTADTAAALLDEKPVPGAPGSEPPTLQDRHLREKITHFDHERIPERVVHARGAGAHGVFVGYGTADAVTTAGFLAEGTFDLVGNNIPVFFIRGRHRVPRRRPRREAPPGPGDPAGAERPRHVLGLRLPPHRGTAPHHLEHVGPRHPSLQPHHGGLRRHTFRCLDAEGGTSPVSSTGSRDWGCTRWSGRRRSSSAGSTPTSTGVTSRGRRHR